MEAENAVAEVDGIAVIINCRNHFISSSGVSYGALGQEPRFSNGSGWKWGISVRELDGGPDQLAALWETSF
jgi:hypothetical protein